MKKRRLEREREREERENERVRDLSFLTMVENSAWNYSIYIHNNTE